MIAEDEKLRLHRAYGALDAALRDARLGIARAVDDAMTKIETMQREVEDCVMAVVREIEQINEEANEQAR